MNNNFIPTCGLERPFLDNSFDSEEDYKIFDDFYNTHCLNCKYMQGTCKFSMLRPRTISKPKKKSTSKHKGGYLSSCEKEKEITTMKHRPLPKAYTASNIYFIETPSLSKSQLSDATKLMLHKEFAPDTRWEMLIRPFNATSVKEDRDLPYNEKIEIARQVFAPYKAVMIVRDTDDESKIAENFTADSIVIVGDNFFFRKNDSPYSHHFMAMSKEEYLDFCYHKSADDRLTGKPAYTVDADEYNDTGWAYEFNRSADAIDSNFMSLYNTFNHSSDSAQNLLTVMYHTREYSRNTNHFDFDVQEERFEKRGISDKARAKICYAKQDAEEVRFLKNRKKAIDTWLEELLNDGDIDKYNEVIDLFAPNHDKALLGNRPTLQTCDCCGTKYDMLRYRCPICHGENEDCPMTENTPWLQNELHGLNSTSTDNPY